MFHSGGQVDKRKSGELKELLIIFPIHLSFKQWQAIKIFSLKTDLPELFKKIFLFAFNLVNIVYY